jgi:hypothetical protein
MGLLELADLYPSNDLTHWISKANASYHVLIYIQGDRKILFKRPEYRLQAMSLPVQGFGVPVGTLENLARPSLYESTAEWLSRKWTRVMLNEAYCSLQPVAHPRLAANALDALKGAQPWIAFGNSATLLSKSFLNRWHPGMRRHSYRRSSICHGLLKERRIGNNS